MILSAGIFAVTGYASAQHADQPDGNQLLAQDPGPDPPVDACSDEEDNDNDGDTDDDDANCCDSSPNSEFSGNCDSNDSCDTSTCGWENQSCGGGAGGTDCDESEMLQQYNCTDNNCDDGNYQCVSHESCGGACDGNIATTTSVLDDFQNDDPNYLDVESSLQCDSNSNNCAQSDSVERSDFFTLSDVLEDGQTPGDLTVSFTDSTTQDWSEGFTADIDCANSADEACEAGAVIQYLKDPDPNPQRSVHTEFDIDGIDNVDKADDWIIEDIEDDRGDVRLLTRASSSIGGSGDYYERARADITIDDIQLQICEANDPPTANDDPEGDGEPPSIDLCSAEVINIYVLDNDSDSDDDILSITDWTEPKDEDEETNGTITKIKTDPPKLSYNPSYGPSTVTFDYTISDGNGGTDTATTTVDVNGTFGSCEGSITVEVEDTSGNSVSADSIEVEYDGDVKNLGSGSSGSTTVDLKDSGADAVIQKSDIDPPEGYDFADQWVKKEEEVETYQEDWKSELGF